MILSLLNDLSYLMILSMISVNIPGIAQDVQSALLALIYFDVFQTDSWSPTAASFGDESSPSLYD